MKYPSMIYVRLYKETYRGEVYKKQYEYDNGCYYVCEKGSPVTSWISLHPSGNLSFLWNGKEQPLNCDWSEIDEVTA